MGALKTFGETTREKTGTQGEAFRGTDRFYARILCTDYPKVRVCGSCTVLSKPLRCETVRGRDLEAQGELIRDVVKGSSPIAENLTARSQGERFQEPFGHLKTLQVRLFGRKFVVTSVKRPTQLDW